jgi:hypothetical protein
MLGSTRGFLQEREVQGERHSLDQFLANGRAFVIDRLVPVELLMMTSPPGEPAV